MKNIHILPTDKPSRLAKNTTGKFHLSNGISLSKLTSQNQNIYITSDEEIKEGDKSLLFVEGFEPMILTHFEPIEKGYKGKKIILTTDQDLIKDGVQAIDDDFLEWFCSKNGEVDFVKVIKHVIWEEYKLILPKEEPKQEACDNCNNEICCCIIRKQETLEEAAIRLVPNRTLKSPFGTPYEITPNRERNTFIKGAKWQQERSYSEDEVLDLLDNFNASTQDEKSSIKEWFEQFKKK